MVNVKVTNMRCFCPFMNINRTEILSASTVVWVETVYTQPLQIPKANYILHVNLLQIIINSYLLLKSKLYLIKKKLCKMQSNLIRCYKTLLYKKHCSTIPSYKVLIFSAFFESTKRSAESIPFLYSVTWFNHPTVHCDLLTTSFSCSGQDHKTQGNTLILPDCPSLCS